MLDDVLTLQGVPRTETRVRSVVRYALGNAVLAAAYLVVAKVSLAAATEHRVVSAIWPPAGIALFALIRYGTWYWPGVALGAYLLNAMTDVAPGAALLIATGDMLESVVGAMLVRKVMGRRRTLNRVRDVVAVSVLAGALSTMIAATIGVATLVFSGGAAASHAAELWLVWWTGDAVGVIVVAPFLLVWTSPELDEHPVRWRWAEAAFLFTTLTAVTIYVFGTTGILAFIVLPVALLPAWRLGPRGAATASVVVALVGAWRTLSGSGPFTGLSPAVNLFTLQVFIAVVAMKNLVFSSARAEAQYGEARVRASEKRYRTLAQKLPDGCVALYNRELRVLLVEGPAVEQAGFTKAGVEGLRLTDIFPPEHAEALGAPFLAGLDGADVEFEFTYKERTYLVRTLPLPDDGSGEAIGMALALDVTEREVAQREVAESRAQLERLSRLLLTAQEDERRRVAREVHDELGQALTAVKIGLSQTLLRAQRRNSLDSERRVQNASDLLDKAIASVQRIILRLRPGVLDNLGPLAALEHEVQQFREQSTLDVAISLPPEPLKIGADQSTALYRTVQEALTNVLRHAKAKRVSVTLLALEHDFVLQVADDGVGISTEQLKKPRSMGLLGMRERAAACGGRLDIASVASGGTCVILRIPRYPEPELLT